MTLQPNAVSAADTLWVGMRMPLVVHVKLQ